jgi:hypothetical protein
MGQYIIKGLSRVSALLDGFKTRPRAPKRSIGPPLPITPEKTALTTPPHIDIMLTTIRQILVSQR